MTRKEKILSMIERLLPDEVTYDRVIYHLTVMKKIEIGLEQADRGEGMEHDEFMKQLLEEECQESGSSGPPKHKRTSAKSASESPSKPRGRRSRS